MSRHGSSAGRGRGRGHFLEGLGVGALSIGGAAAAIGATYKLGEAAVHLKRLFGVRGENAVFVRLVERTKLDLDEVERLMAIPAAKEALRNNKPKTLWIKSKIEALTESIGAMQQYTRKVAKAGWWLGLKTRIWWVLHEHEKLCHRELELNAAREGVLAVIAYLEQFEEAPEKQRKVKEEEIRSTTKHTHVDVDVDVDVDTRREGGRRVIELDYEGRPIDPRYVEEDYIEEEYDTAPPRPRNFEREGFYYGQLDGPLSTRPSWWQQKYGQSQPQEQEYTERRRTVVEETKTDVPLRVHWPSKL